jgi:catechol 2,3-dioxygenase-like lactoylglutathione lyase family enzyme
MAQTGAAQAQLEQLGLPPLCQIGFVVRDMDAAIALYEPMFGPFKSRADGELSAEYRGRREPYELKIAFGYSGPLQIELIQWVSGHTPHREFLEAGREGMHHVQVRVDDVDGWSDKLKAAGYDRIWYDRMSPDIAYAYYERAGDPLILELLEFPHEDLTVKAV